MLSGELLKDLVWVQTHPKDVVDHIKELEEDIIRLQRLEYLGYSNEPVKLTITTSGT